MMRFFIVVLYFCAAQAFASVVVDGNFRVENDCPAYLSKNKKTNPGSVTVSPEQIYPLIEANKKNAPDWFRISGINHEQSLRWVHSSCGAATYTVKDYSNCDLRPGLADSNVLAVSWQPAFCETYGYEIGKPECLQLDRKSFAASHLVLHGLWPGQQQCGMNYSYCGISAQSNHCDYSQLTLSNPVKEQLAIFMPSYRYGSCLERHEWAKHGSCQNLSQSDYFATAMRLVTALNETPFASYLHDHVGEEVTLSQLEALIDRSFGKDMKNKVYLGCKYGLLVDIYIQLPAKFDSDQSLIELIQQASQQEQVGGRGCPQQVKISDFKGV